MERLLELGSFDLLISLSAGLLVQPCTPYVARHGYLLVNDSHSDARAAFVSGDWELKAYWDEETKSFSQKAEVNRHRANQLGPSQGKCGGRHSAQPILQDAL
eukprot:CAMPEP_0178770490 /NCGR_PEP_ID=MMETSP0744-20121128/21424_1 /TAXON_ID=913974 /ORGANISM="Nitzschia punctata, Strain CCMP561" /LENGTH=101 /DNA_ID=CAMNT_0020426879 /DNA_START=41 /DNA_END=346 /DNA_ORIENTATION=-